MAHVIESGKPGMNLSHPSTDAFNFLNSHAVEPWVARFLFNTGPLLEKGYN